MKSNRNSEQNPPVFTSSAGVLAPRSVPAVLTRSGQNKAVVLIRSDSLAPQLQRLLEAGMRHVEVTVWVDGVTVTTVAAIVRRGKLPVQLHPIGQAGKYFSELYNRRRAASGRKRSPVPLLILSVAPLVESEVQRSAGERRP